MEWNKELVHEVVLKQRKYFETGTTLPIKSRISALKKLKNAILDNSEAIYAALKADLNKSETESLLCEVQSCVAEINEAISHLKRWAKPETHYSGFVAFPSFKTKVYKMPYGVTLIVSPFNFPILLSLGVLAASISAGNTAVIKASSKSKECTKVLQDIVSKTFREDFVTVIDGGHDIADYCLEERFDKIFYTGSPNVAKHVMEKASVNLTPVALELGGETGNWAIVRKDANIKDAARKLAFFKSLNAGQVCIMMNQIAVAEEIADSFVEELKKAFVAQLGEEPYKNEEYPKLITSRAYETAVKEMELYKDRIVFGGTGDPKISKLSPTIIYPVSIEEEIVNHELFCPLLPIVKFKDNEVDKLLDVIAKREHGLALYVFSKDIKWAKRVMSTQQYGGGCINEVVMHQVIKGCPFNGVGHSGMGAYHGEWGFREFSHPSTVLFGKTHFNLNLREHTYLGKPGEKKRKLIKIFFK